MHLILPSAGMGLLLGFAGWLVYARGTPTRLELDDTMSLFLAATTVLVMSAFWFLPLYHDKDGTTTVLVSMPFGAMGTVIVHFTAQGIQLATGIGAFPARFLMLSAIFVGVCKAWTFLLGGSPSPFTNVVLLYICVVVASWVVHGAMIDGLV